MLAVATLTILFVPGGMDVFHRTQLGAALLGGLAIASGMAGLLLLRAKSVAKLSPELPVWTTLQRLALVALPIVIVGRVGAVEKTISWTRAVICLNRGSGAILWTRECADDPRGLLHHHNSPATSTPTVDENGVYAYFGTLGLVGFSHGGERLWQRTDVPFESAFGAGVSPVSADGVVVLSSGTTQNSYVAAIDTKTGQLRWRVERPPTTENGENRTPSVVNLPQGKAVLVWGHRNLIAYGLENGKELFNYTLPLSWRLGSHVASPVVRGDDVFIPMKDGAARLSLNGLATGKDPIVWQSRGPGADCASPVLVNGILFLVSDGGIASAVHATSGESLWRQRLPGGEYLASLFADSKHVYAINSDGIVTAFSADKTFHRIFEIDMKESVHASMAVSHGRLYLRTQQHLYSIGSGR